MERTVSVNCRITQILFDISSPLCVSNKPTAWMQFACSENMRAAGCGAITDKVEITLMTLCRNLRSSTKLQKLDWKKDKISL